MTLAQHSLEEQLRGLRPPGSRSSSEQRGEPGFLRELRLAGREAFLASGLPTPRDEDWRYTSLAALAATSFAAAPPGRLTPGRLPPAPRLAFVNGHLDPRASDLTGLPAGARMGSLAAALRERPSAVEPHLGRAIPAAPRFFAALNMALFSDGALVELDAGVTCALPLHLVFLTEPGGSPVVAFPRALVVAGAGSSATVVEHHLGEGVYLASAVTELVLAEGATVEHDRVQEDAPGAFHLASLVVAQAAASRLTSASIALGGRLARVEVRALLGGENARCDLAGLSVASGEQLLDHWVHVDHARPRCASRQFFKGILDGQSRGVFAGRILVREDAQQTDAGQVSSNLLLSDEAVADAKPQLEILADDVKCSHGGTVGQLRPDQLFYLRTRGLPEAVARALLTWAFASEVVGRVGPEALRAELRRKVAGRLPQGDLIAEAA